MKIGEIVKDQSGKTLGKYKECSFCKTIFIAKQPGNKTCSKECSASNKAIKTSNNRKGKPSWNSGKTGVYSLETLEKMGAKNKGKKLSTEHKDAISSGLSEFYLENDHHLLNGNLSVEHKQKIQETLFKNRATRTKLIFLNIQDYCKENNLDLRTSLSESEPMSQFQHVEVLCTCGKVYSARVQNLFKGQYRKCRSCGLTTSQGEQQIRDFLNMEELLLNKRPQFMDGLELDLYVPSKQVAIEYHGLVHHSLRPVFGEKDFSKYKNLHLNKYMNCKKEGIKLIQVFEDEWYEKPEIVKSIINSKLGKTSKKIYARDCIIQELTKEQTLEFQNETHINGYTQAKYSYGLFYNNELVSCISFRKTWNKSYGEGVIEIARFSSSLNTQIIGGFQKLLKYSIAKLKLEGFVKILTYADCRFGSGEVYKLAGFEHLGHTGPNYFYEKNGIRESRFSHKKDNNREGTEVSQNQEDGWYQLYDAGSEIYLLSI